MSPQSYIRERYETKINQENRIKLMLSTARLNLLKAADDSEAFLDNAQTR